MSRPTEEIRWTVERAASEFGIDRKTLTGRIRAAGLEKGDDDKYSTRQIATAVYGDLEREKIRNESAAADLREMARDEKRGALLPADAVLATWEAIVVAIKQVIMQSPMPDADKKEALGNLRSLDVRDYMRTAALTEDDQPSEAGT